MCIPFKYSKYNKVKRIVFPFSLMYLLKNWKHMHIDFTILQHIIS